MNEEMILDKIDSLIDSQKALTDKLDKYIENHQSKHEIEKDNYFKAEQCHAQKHSEVLQEIAKHKTEMKFITWVISLAVSGVVSILITLLKSFIIK